MTGRAVFTLLFGGGMLLFSLATGNPAPFVPGVLALCLLFTAFLSCLMMLLTLRFSLSAEAPEAELGGRGTLLLSFRAHALLPCAPVTVSVELPGTPAERYAVGVRCWGESRARVPFACAHVGAYAPEISRAAVADCFGFFLLPSPHPARRCSFLVLPPVRQLRLPEIREGEASRPGPLQEPDADAPEGLRDWREGDELKRVHWKLSLRRGVVTVRTHEALRRPNTLILLSARLPEGSAAPGDVTDALCASAAGIARQSILRGGALRLCLPQGRELSLPLLRPSDLLILRRALAGARFGSAERTAARLLAACGGVNQADAVYLVTAVLDARTADALITLRASGAAVSLLLCRTGQAEDEGALFARLQGAGVTLLSSCGKEAGAA